MVGKENEEKRGSRQRRRRFFFFFEIMGGEKKAACEMVGRGSRWKAVKEGNNGRSHVC